MSEAIRFATNPGEYFNGSARAAHRMDNQDLAALQLSAMQYRFEKGCKTIPAVRFLAERVGVERIDAIEDIGPLLFPHGIYKSYPQHWLVEYNFQNLTRWIGKFTAHDLSGMRAFPQPSIDDWLAAMDEHTPLRLAYSSGTTGRFSFFPRSVAEKPAMHSFHHMHHNDLFEIDGAHSGSFDGHVVHLSPRNGRHNSSRALDTIEESLAIPNSLHTLNQHFTSADVQLYFAKSQLAMKKGVPVDFPASPYVLQRMEEDRESFRARADDIDRVHKLLSGPLSNEKYILLAYPFLLHEIAQHALDQGHVGAASNVQGRLCVGGGTKGRILPEDWEDAIHGYFGSHFVKLYGMTEVQGSMRDCANGRFHCQPWTIPFIVDPETGAMKPRSGTQRGHIAFFDLTPESYWGGIISADRVELSWDACGCGRTTPHVGPEIERANDEMEDRLVSVCPDEAIADLIAYCS